MPLFDGLKARLDRLFRERSSADPREYATRLREALLEAKVGLAGLRDGIAATERELAAERKQLSDAERRGRLAGAVPDAETVAIAERFASRHRERVAVLERKLVVQRDELLLAEREVQEWATQYRTAAGGVPPSASIDAAWRDLEAAGASRASSEEERFAVDADQRRREQAIEAQLAYLKKKLGKE